MYRLVTDSTVPWFISLFMCQTKGDTDETGQHANTTRPTPGIYTCHDRPGQSDVTLLCFSFFESGPGRDHSSWRTSTWRRAVRTSSAKTIWPRFMRRSRRKRRLSCDKLCGQSWSFCPMVAGTRRFGHTLQSLQVWSGLFIKYRQVLSTFCEHAATAAARRPVTTSVCLVAIFTEQRSSKLPPLSFTTSPKVNPHQFHPKSIHLACTTQFR